MLYIPNEFQDPHYNLALEEYILKEKKFTETCIMLWQNEPSIIIGRFQNTIEEINVEYVNKHSIHVVRRISGGGAVYHDLGNLNFTFIESRDSHDIDFQKYTGPIIKALGKLGINAENSGRNDITIEGRKFSGNAQYKYRDKILHHGTILYDSRLDNVQEALNVKSEKIESKGIKSVRSRVTNISEYMKEPVPIKEFKKHLLTQLFDDSPIREYRLTLNDIERVECLMVDKYMTWEWNYGSSPAFNIQKTGRFPWGGIDIRLKVDKGIIRNCTIFGDFFGDHDLGEFTNKLIGIMYREDKVRALLDEIDLREYFGRDISKELLEVLFA